VSWTIQGTNSSLWRTKNVDTAYLGALTCVICASTVIQFYCKCFIFYQVSLVSHNISQVHVPTTQTDNACAHTYTHVHIHVNSCTRIYVYLYTHTVTHTHTNTRIHTRTHIHTHTHTRTHTHTHTHAHRRCC